MALIIIWQTTPAEGYEFSIYEAYPNGIFLIFLTFVIGLTILLLIIFQENISKIQIILALLPILLCDIIMLFLPTIRGYYIYGDGDILSHIGHMIDIQKFHFIIDNRYPMDHILGNIIVYFTGITNAKISLIIPPLFSLIMVLLIYIFANELHIGKREKLLVLALATIPMFGTSNVLFFPNGQAFCIFTLGMYLLLKIFHNINTWQPCVLLTIFTISLVFFHPLVFIVFLMVIGALISVIYLHDKAQYSIQWFYFSTIAIGLLFFVIWSDSLNLGVNNILEPILNGFLNNIETNSELVGYSQKVSNINLDYTYLGKLIFKTYGQYILLGTISIICIALMGFLIIKKNFLIINTDLVFIGVGFLFFSIFSIFLLFKSGAFGFLRVYKFAQLFSIILIPTTLIFYYKQLKLHSKFNARTIYLFFAIIFVVTLTYFSFFNLHLSPSINGLNQQVPQSYYSGMEKFYEHRNTQFKIMEFGISQRRYYHAMFGQIGLQQNVRWYGVLSPPDHFNYQKYPTLGQGLIGTEYFILTSKGIEFYPKLYPEFKNKWRYNPNDFERIDQDTSIKKVYSNDNLLVFLIND
ncbi:hypothetical protein [Methanogenium sp. MK-MG]|uniref:hypothetical protein n=1 Tax=Methanogenium sp. MK-MG TaxID=2599926 RepID=UPI0013EC96A7|nr:hypothetical protein [Methanogenium sp. MK-MG]